MVMPITEHLCNWDRFLRGGPDVEFSVLAGLLFAAMIVLSMHGTMMQPAVVHPKGMHSPASTIISCDRAVGRFASHRALNSPIQIARARQEVVETAPALGDRMCAVPLRI
jgi:hypothetical protein